jgi:hypothetical protein
MTKQTPFDHRHDPVMGDALRAALSSDDDDVFVRQVLARVGEPVLWWEVLSGWLRPGLAAALLLTALGGYWLGQAVREVEQPPIALEEGLTADVGNGTMAALISPGGPPDVDVLFAVNGND